MALFKILRGNSEDLKNPEKAPLRDGFAYFTPDDGNFYIDAEIDGSIKRIQLNALKAQQNSEGIPLDDAYLNVNGDTVIGALKYANATNINPEEDGAIVHKLYVDAQDAKILQSLGEEINYITPKFSFITTSTGNAWIQETEQLYYQQINSIPNITIDENTKVDLLTTGNILIVMQERDILALWVENNNGVLILKCLEDNNEFLSQNSLTIPVLCTQVQKFE